MKKLTLLFTLALLAIMPAWAQWTSQALNGTWAITRVTAPTNYNTSQGQINAQECWEGWGNADFSYKHTRNLPVGTYRLRVNAFYRQGNNYAIAPRESKGYLAATVNGITYKNTIATLASASKTSGYADGLQSAAEDFGRGLYENTLIFHVASAGDVTFGIEGDMDKSSQSWCAFSSFILEKLNAGTPGTAEAATCAQLNREYTVEVDGTVGSPITLSTPAGFFSYTPATDAHVTFSRHGDNIVVYEGDGTTRTYKATLQATGEGSHYFPAIIPQADGSVTNSLLIDGGFKAHGEAVTNGWKLGPAWISTANYTGSQVARVADNTNNASADKSNLMWRGTGNDRYFAQAVVAKPNTNYLLIVKQIEHSNGAAYFHLGLSNTTSGLEYGDRLVELGRPNNDDQKEKNVEWTYDVKTPATMKGATYFTFKNTNPATNDVTAQLDPLTFLDYVALVEGQPAIPYGLSGATLASHSDESIPFPIGSAADLKAFAALVNDGATDLNGVLTARIECPASFDFPGIGTAEHPFCGTLDGQGYYIDNLHMSDGDNIGLIRYAAAGCRVFWVVMYENCSFSGANNVSSFIANVTGTGAGKVEIERCANECSVTATGTDAGKYAGGFLGKNSNPNCRIVMKDVSNNGHITATSHAGALAGDFGNLTSQVFNSYNVDGVTGYDGEGTEANPYLTMGCGISASNFINSYDLVMPYTYDADNGYETSNESNIVRTILPQTLLAGYDRTWLTNGHLCYLLNGDQSEIVWRQTLGVDGDLSLSDKHPMFTLVSSPVYAIGQRLHCDGHPYNSTEDGEAYTAVATYSNNPSSVQRDEHNYDAATGLCSVCSKLQEDWMQPKGDGFFELGSAAQLHWFAHYVEHINPAANARMVSNIDYSSYTAEGRIGSSPETSFQGTFDGQEHILTIALTDAQDGHPTALFPYIENATLRNLIVDGTVKPNGSQYAGGLVGKMLPSCSLDNILVRVAITEQNATATDNANHGGLVGVIGTPFVGTDGRTNYIRNCGFVGSLDSKSRKECGGLVGYNHNGGEIYIQHCLVAPLATLTCSDATNHKAIACGGADHIENCYINNKVSGQGTQKNVTSGEACYLLNEKGGAWTQNLDHDDYPFPFLSHSTVFQGKYAVPTHIPLSSALGGTTEFYLYNIETSSFIRNGADYNARATTKQGDGNKFKISETSGAPGTYTLRNEVRQGQTIKSDKYFFVDAHVDWIYTDADNLNPNGDNNQDLRHPTGKRWTMIHLGDNKYQIGNTSFPGNVLIASADHGDDHTEFIQDNNTGDEQNYRRRLVKLAPSGNSTWILVKATDFDNYMKGEGIVTTYTYSNANAAETYNAPNWNRFRRGDNIAVYDDSNDEKKSITTFYICNTNSNNYIQGEIYGSKPTGVKEKDAQYINLANWDINKAALWKFSGTTSGTIQTTSNVKLLNASPYNELRNQTNASTGWPQYRFKVLGVTAWVQSGSGSYKHWVYDREWNHADTKLERANGHTDNNGAWYLFCKKQYDDSYKPYEEAWFLLRKRYWDNLANVGIPTLATLKSLTVNELNEDHGDLHWDSSTKTAPAELGRLTIDWNSYADLLAKIKNDELEVTYVNQYNRLTRWPWAPSLVDRATELQNRMLTWDNVDATIIEIKDFCDRFFAYNRLWYELKREYEYPLYRQDLLRGMRQYAKELLGTPVHESNIAEMEGKVRAALQFLVATDQLKEASSVRMPDALMVEINALIESTIDEGNIATKQQIATALINQCEAFRVFSAKARPQENAFDIDYTFRLKNPSAMRGGSGWGEDINYYHMDGNATGDSREDYFGISTGINGHTTMKQTISGLPAGEYELSFWWKASKATWAGGRWGYINNGQKEIGWEGEIPNNLYVYARTGNNNEAPAKLDDGYTNFGWLNFPLATIYNYDGTNSQDEPQGHITSLKTTNSITTSPYSGQNVKNRTAKTGVNVIFGDDKTWTRSKFDANTLQYGVPHSDPSDCTNLTVGADGKLHIGVSSWIAPTYIDGFTLTRKNVRSLPIAPDGISGKTENVDYVKSVDAISAIYNPRGEDIESDEDNAHGWQNSEGALKEVGSGSDTWLEISSTYDAQHVQQIVTGLPAGDYDLTVQYQANGKKFTFNAGDATTGEKTDNSTVTLSNIKVTDGTLTLTVIGEGSEGTTDKIKFRITGFIYKGCTEDFDPGTNLTYTRLLNAGFEQGNMTGWNQGEVVNTFKANTTDWQGTDPGTGRNDNGTEFFAKDFNYYRTVTLAAGNYIVRGTGYYRAGWWDPCWEDYKADRRYRHAKMYVTIGGETKTVDMMHLYDSNGLDFGGVYEHDNVGVGLGSRRYPDNMGEAHSFFERDEYSSNYVAFNLSSSATVTIGFKKETTIDGDWTMLDGIEIIKGGYVEGVGDTGVQDGTTPLFYTLGSGGRYLYNTWMPSGQGIPVTQTTTLPAGIYRLEANVATDGANKVYLTATGTGVSPNQSYGKQARQNNKHVMLKETLTFKVTNQTPVTIGAKGNADGTGWFKADDFQLIYLGDGTTTGEKVSDIYGTPSKNFPSLSGATETFSPATGSDDAQKLAAINQNNTTYDDYLWRNASQEHPYKMLDQCFQFDNTCRTLEGTEGFDRYVTMGYCPDVKSDEYLTRDYLTDQVADPAHPGNKIDNPALTTDAYWAGRKGGRYEGMMRVPFVGAYKVDAWIKRTADDATTGIQMGLHTKGEVGKTTVEGTENGIWVKHSARFGIPAIADVANVGYETYPVTFLLNENSYMGGQSLYYIGRKVHFNSEATHTQYYFGDFTDETITFQPTPEYPAICAHDAHFPQNCKLDRSQNKNGLLYLAEEDETVVNTGTTSGDDEAVQKANIVRSDASGIMSCKRLELTDGATGSEPWNFVAPFAFNALTAEYTMTAPVGTNGTNSFGTLCLPFNITEAKHTDAENNEIDIDIFCLDKSKDLLLPEGNGESTVYLTKVNPAETSLNNTPMLVTNNGTFTGSGLVSATNWGERAYDGLMVGVYQKTQPELHTWLLQKHEIGGKDKLAFYRVEKPEYYTAAGKTAPLALNPFRCYIMRLPADTSDDAPANPAAQNSEARRMVIVIDGEVVELPQAEAEESTKLLPNSIYDLSGRKLERTTHRGIYIMNGKKIIVR